MKIDGTSLSPVGSVQAANRLSRVEKKAAGMGTDKVAVSDQAQVFQALLQKAKELPAVREDRVRELSEQITKGEFRIDADKIAARLGLKPGR